MCLLLLHHRTRTDWPLVLLANRDEWFDRPFEGPALRDAEHGILAPRDLRAGGTWLGRNRHGLVAAVTNRRGEDAAEGARSRGLLVGDALRWPDARAALDFVRGHLAAVAYAGFHLLLADGRDAFVVRHRGSSDARPPAGSDVLALPPGAHVLTNLHEPDEVAVPPGGEAVPDEPLDRTLSRLQRLAADAVTPLPGGHRILKREPSRGTVCSAVLALPADPRRAGVFRFAAGAPDVTPFLDVRVDATSPGGGPRA